VSAALELPLNLPVAGLSVIPLATANALLARWGHYLGPVSRPFGSQAWALDVAGEPVSVAVSCSTVSETAAGLRRGELVELARLCSDPSARWATRPMLRLWREVAAPRWPYWPVTAAIAYSQNARHQGDLYRWDGWAKVADDCGSSGGGAWSRRRYATDAVHGRKTLWLWRYGGGEVTG
jgi:hypothetical protein